MNKNNFTALIFSFLITACGGGGGNDSSATQTPPPAPTPTPEPTVLTGQFIDSSVQGLKYETATQSGTTNALGEFQYIADENITFSIGGITFPTIKAAEIITPLEVFDTTDINEEKVINMLRLLQSLDIDGMPENGIELATNIHELASDLTFSFDALNFDILADGLLLLNNAIHINLIPEYQALEHFQASLLALGIITESECGADHPMVGYSGTFQTYAHNVAGSARILDNCTIAIENFTYDGGGPDVYFYGAIDNDFRGNTAFEMGEQLNPTVFNNDMLIISLPNNKTLDDLNSLSVWCVLANANFGDLVFTP